MTFRTSYVAIVAVALGALACASNPPPQEPTTTGATTAEPSTTTGESMGNEAAPTQTQQGPSTTQNVTPTQQPMAQNPFTTDAQIAGFVQAANKGTVAQAKVALRRAKDPQVKAFARYMIKQHGDAQASQKKLFTSLNITPVDNATTTDLVNSAQNAITSLESKSGADFDKAYIDLMVSEHKAVIDTLDKDLMPAVQNATLKDELTKMKPELEEHLRRAEALQAKLSKM